MTQVHVVLEGAATAAASPSEPDEVHERAGALVVWRARADGDDAIVRLVPPLVAGQHGTGDVREVVVVVTADRALRDRLPAGVRAVGPRWLWDLLDGRREGVAATPGG